MVGPSGSPTIISAKFVTEVSSYLECNRLYLKCYNITYPTAFQVKFEEY